jgi:hypothetical protein
MASLDSLPPDQRAVLELVLARGRSYDEIAKVLTIDRAGVRERALAAFDALGPQTRVPAERRALITDYLLGALPPLVADDVHKRLADSPSERAWARVVASELQPLAANPLPEIPVDAGSQARVNEPAAPVAETAPASEPAPAALAATAADTGGPDAPDDGGAPRRSSRRGGAILLGLGAAVVVAVVLVLVLSGGSSKKPASTVAASTGTPTTPTTPTTSTTSKSGTQVVAQINLKPPSGSKSPVGIAEVLRQQGKTGIAIVAQGLTPNSKKPANAYAVWLYNSPSDSRILGFVNPGVGSNGRLQTAGGLPTNASHFTKLLVTRETASNPKSPGTIVLEGTLTGV